MNALNAFIRRMAVLSVLWAFCEMLLPEGRQRRAVRLTVSLMMAAALLSSVTALLPASAERVQESFALFRQAEGSAAAERLRCRPLLGKRKRFWCVWPKKQATMRREASGYAQTGRCIRRK